MELHPHEIRVLKGLKAASTPRELAESVGLPLDAVMRATSWLATKKLVEVAEEVTRDVTLGSEGVAYAKEGLPERQLIKLIGDGVPLSNLKKKADTKAFAIGFGWLRRKGQVRVEGDTVYVSDAKEKDDERLLKMLAKGRLNTGQLNKGELAALKLLESRKSVVDVKDVKSITLKPTKAGLKLAKGLKEDDSISQLTPKMLSTGSWRGKRFRPYDTGLYVSPQSPVRKHPLVRQIGKVRRIFTSMGFTEISGPLIESSFWNFDALFQPQDHPARDMHDTFYVENPKTVKIEDFERLKDKVAATHEGGGSTGSRGWGYKWDPKIAKKPILRTHTTAVTARHLAKLSADDMPVKVFSIGKVFRNEDVDYKHLPEFYQVEGIVVDPSVNFRHLLGILKQFYDEMGFSKVRFRPGYFPYTEMSVEPEVWFAEKKEWVELGGAGIFRPEVVAPLLGAEVPVLAWGLGLDRVVALSQGLSDIRQLYLPDLDWLRQN